MLDRYMTSAQKVAALAEATRLTLPPESHRSRRKRNLERIAVIETAPEPWQSPTLPLRQTRSENFKAGVTRIRMCPFHRYLIPGTFWVTLKTWSGMPDLDRRSQLGRMMC